MQVNPLESLERKEVREQLKLVDVIIGHDLAQGGKEVLFYGREMLRRVVAENASRECNIFHVAYDSRTDQLEWLIAAVGVLKGHCCYNDATHYN